MNLFCFTLEGSTESMYEPAYSRTVREVRPKYQCSPALLRRRPEWGGSDPALNSSKCQTAKTRRSNVKSCFVTPTLDTETIDLRRACWISSDDKKDLAHQKKVPDKDICETSKDKETRTQSDSMLQASETAADTAESIKARRLKKLQNLVPTKKGGQQSASGKEGSLSENYDHLTDVLSSYNPVLTCIGLGKREKKPTVASPSPVRSDSVSSREPSEVESVWSPLESPFEPWSPQHCHEPGHVFRHELWERGSALSLPRTAAWDRFESLIRELDRKQPDPCLPHMVRSITDLDLHQDELTRFGRFDAFRQQWPLMTAQDHGDGCTKPTNPGGDSDVTPLQETEMAPCKDSNAVKTGDTTSITMKDKGPGGELTKGRSNSLESLYSSGQSSSSGVTSGSNCSSNRTSLRLDDDVSSPRHFCGRARVHTEFVPNPYDTESLKLKVGDVIDIISKPAMGTWTGMLNNKIGYFKFIYVDLLKDESSDSSESKTEESCILELLKRFDLEGYALTLVLHGYQTAEDLLKLKERHLIELKVTDPEHRRRLLSAVSTLSPLHSDSREAVYENVRSSPRDSGCGMVSPDSTTELHSPPEHSHEDVVTAS